MVLDFVAVDRVDNFPFPTLTYIISVIISIYNRENINLHHFRRTIFQNFFVRIYQNFCLGMVDPTECKRVFGFLGVQFLGRELEERTGQGLRASARGVGRADGVGMGLGGSLEGLRAEGSLHQIFPKKGLFADIPVGKRNIYSV